MYSYKRIKNPIQRFTDRILKVLWRYNIAERDYDIERCELVRLALDPYYGPSSVSTIFSP